MGAREIRFVKIPRGFPEGWDLADALEAGWTPQQASDFLRANVCRAEEFAAYCAELDGAQRELERPAPPNQTAPSQAERATHQPGAPVATRRGTTIAFPGPANTEPPNREEPPPHGDGDAPLHLAGARERASEAARLPDEGEPSVDQRPRGEDDHFIDRKNPLDTARRFLAVTERNGLHELVRWQAGYWRALGTRYELREDEEVDAEIYGYIDGKWDLDTNRPIKPGPNLVKSIEHALRAAALLPVKQAPAWIGHAAPRPPAEEMVAFANGLLHVPTRRWTQPTRAFFGLNAVGFDYDPRAPEPRNWLGFLSQLWPDDGESIETTQEIFGLALTGDTSFQKLFLMVGPKRSGKGTIARVLTAMVGTENVSAPSLSLLGQHFGLEGLIGKTLAVISDARLGGRVDLVPVVENLLRISGEDTISVPRKHRADWTAKLRGRFVIISNELPNFTDQSGALASRFVVLRLMRSFYGEEDRGLTDRLLRELPGIVLWSLAGLARLRERGFFRQPASALEFVRQLENLGSPLSSFVADACVVTPSASVSCATLFEAWQDWCREQGRDHAGTSGRLQPEPLRGAP